MALEPKMQSQTELVLEALGQHDVALLLLRLLDGQATERDLRDALDLSQPLRREL
jgi:hypothetical protein